jgi:beta-lactamase regulating signal transducer with metallopeptidase domain
MTIVIPSSESFLMQLLSPAARTLVLAGAAGLALSALRVKATSARLFTWKAVLYAALAMPLLGWALPRLTVPVPSIVQFTPSHLPEPLKLRPDAALTPLPSRNVTVQREASLSRVPATLVRRQTTPPIQWSALAAALYFVVAAILLVRLSIGLLLGRRLLHDAKQICDERVSIHLTRHARSFGLNSIPALLKSEIIIVPVTMGVLRPTILLPNNWRDWDDAKLDAVVAHEMSHVARRDSLTQHLSLLHRAIFWFSPLAWWLERHLAALAEQASDEAALFCGADARDYARTLLGFFETLHAAPGRVWWQGVAMASGGQAEQRLERILAWNKEGAITMGLKKSVAAAILVFAVPTIFLAASIRPLHDPIALGKQEAQAPLAPAKPSAALAAPNVPLPDGANEPMAPPSQGATVAPGVVVISPHGITSVAPIAPMAALAPVSPIAPRAPFSGQSGHSGYSYAYGSDDDERFVIVSGKTDSLTMSGSTQDARHVERLRKQIPGDFIWFQRDEKSYIIRDQATIDRARSFWAPQEELGKKQEELGKQQEALGKQQEALGHKMEQVRVNVPDMTAALDKLKAELKNLGATATQDQLGRIQSEIGELQSRLGDMQSHAGDQQSKVGEEMSALGEQQGKLGEQQGKLGEEQAEAAEKATQKMKALFDEAIKNGKAQPEQEPSGGASL